MSINEALEEMFKRAIREVIREELAAIKGNGAPQDELLTAKEAAALLKCSTDHLYKEQDRLPYTVRISMGMVRFSKNEIMKEINRKLKLQTERKQKNE